MSNYLSGLYRGAWALPVLAAIISLVVTAPVLAQARDTGTMAVRVVDPDGAPLPGVMVHIQGPLGTRTDYTGTDGTTRFPGLPPGMYTATFSIDGFKTVVREELRISVGRTVSVDVNMELASVAETITVTGESPMVDVKSTNVGNLYTNELVDYAPTASGIWAGILDHVPGVVNSDIDVGGGESGQQSTFSARGASSNQNIYNINGANTTDPAALGASSFYYSIGSFEEVGVSTASHDMEVQTPGVMLNMVTKTGSNDWHGAAKFFYENDSFVSTNVDAELEARGAEEGNPNTLLRDLDLQVGGPILRNRAWFFVDYWDFKVERKIIGLPPDERDDTTLENWTLNGTWQASESHKISARYFTDRKFRGNRGAGPTTPPETAWIQDSFVDIPQLQYQGVLGPNTFVDVRFSKMDMEFPLEAKDADSPRPHPNFDPSVAPSVERRTGDEWGPPVREVFFQRDNASLSGNLQYYLTSESQSHDFKFGGEYQRTQSFSPDRRGYTFGFQQQFLDGNPSRVRFWNTPAADIFSISAPNANLLKGQNWGLFAQDTWTIANRVTITAGVRYDWSETWVPAQSRLDSVFTQLGSNFQAASFDEVRPVTEWSDIVPRAGIIFDLRGDGRTALKANYSRYSQQQGVTWASFVNPNGIGNQLYTWVDANGDGVFQFGEQDRLLSQFFPSVSTQIDDELSSPLTDEFIAGVEHELMNNFLLSGSFIYRTDTNFIEDINVGNPYGPIARFLGVPDVIYSPVTAADPGPDGVLGTADDGGPITIFSQDQDSFGDDVFRVTNPVDIGFPEDLFFNDYKGVSLVLHKRWSNNWQVLASWDIGRAESAFGAGSSGTSTFLDNPNDDINRGGLSSWDRTHLVKVTGNYLIAEPIGVNIGAFLRVMSGAPLIRTAVLPATGDTATIAQGTDTIIVGARGKDSAGPERLDTVTIFDVRAEKQFGLGRWGVLHGYADVFNLFNTNTITGQRTASGSRWGEVTSLVPPRVFRLGAAWDF